MKDSKQTPREESEALARAMNDAAERIARRIYPGETPFGNVRDLRRAVVAGIIEREIELAYARKDEAADARGGSWLDTQLVTREAAARLDAIQSDKDAATARVAGDDDLAAGCSSRAEWERGVAHGYRDALALLRSWSAKPERRT